MGTIASTKAKVLGQFATGTADVIGKKIIQNPNAIINITNATSSFMAPSVTHQYIPKIDLSQYDLPGQ